MNEEMYYAGIDPGQSGALAIIDANGALDGTYAFDKHVLFTAHGLPVALKHVLENKGVKMLCLEKVNAMPKQGVTSTFKFGKGYGMIIGALDIINVPYVLIRPQQWQKKVLAGLTRGDKNVTKDYCRRKYDFVMLLGTERCKVPHSGICDAICMAEYTRITDMAIKPE